MGVGSTVSGTRHGRSFELVRSVRGEFGEELWEAREAVPDGSSRKIVLKFLPDWRQADAVSRARFIRESGWICTLSEQSGGLARILDIGVDDHLGPWLAMECLRGNLDSLIQDAPGDPHVVRTVLLDIARGLSALHGHTPPMLHLEVNPAHIRRSDESHFKLADFRRVRAPGANTSPDAASYKFAAPERLRRLDPAATATRTVVGPWTDLYSLGICVYELAVGRTLFEKEFARLYAEGDAVQRRVAAASERAAWIAWHCDESKVLATPAALLPNYPQDLSSAIAGLIAKPVSARIQSCSELIQMIDLSIRATDRSARAPSFGSGLLKVACVILVCALTGVAIMASRAEKEQTEQRNALSSELSGVRTQLDQSSQTAAQQRAALTAKDDEIRALRMAQSESDKTKKTVSEAVREKDEHIVALEKQRDQMQKEFEAVKSASKKECEALIAQHQEKLDKLRTESNAQQQKMVKEFDETLNPIFAEMKKVVAANEAVGKQLAEEQKKNAAATAAISKLSDELSAKSRDLSAALELSRSIDAKVSGLETALANARADKKKGEEQVMLVSANLAQKTTECAALIAEKKKNDEAFASYQTEKKTFDEKAAKAASELTQKSSELAKLQAEKKTLDDQLTESNTALAKATAALNAANSDKIKMAEQIKQLNAAQAKTTDAIKVQAGK